jgi:hypothetical protein
MHAAKASMSVRIGQRIGEQLTAEFHQESA